ncbi:ABC transporter substrate-binding protein [Bradyrhizobium sp. sGM-13]|uniref:ABC transporter substrate-binding protein n=1 Tax=Bradyrhizobium sp. sGM-13 TaxID=2831781 RepID=UPI001BCC2C3B|nr:ABC transporter substrate-binding protein [Bradyrhizobium sp. sGM-13]
MSKRSFSTIVRMAAVATLSLGLGLAPSLAQSGPALKVAVIETLSGSQAATGSLHVPAAQYAIDRLNAAGGYNGKPIQLLTYDNQGTPTGASAQVTAAIGDGVRVIVQGASSAIAGQITEDVRRYNLRNPKQPIIYLNSAAEARELTGEKCHFYHFKFALDAEMRLRAAAKAIHDRKIQASNVFSINQDYSWGRDMDVAIKGHANEGGYKVVDAVLHDVNRIQDFTPYVTRIAATNADAVITGNWGTDLVRLMRASADSKLKARFITMFLDVPGNITSAGDAAEGHIFLDVFNAEANGERGIAFQKDFLERTKAQTLANNQAHTVFALLFLGEALKLAPANGSIDVRNIAEAMEKVTLDSPAGTMTMRSDDHQALLPIAITKVSRDAAIKVENSSFGFKPLLKIDGPDAIVPPQSTCKMQRPS